MQAPRFGLGFRPRYFGDLVDGAPRVDWLELVSENFMAIGGRTRAMRARLTAAYPLALHGVSLSIAGAAPLDADHLRALRELADAVEPLAVGDHLCWTSWRGRESHDLLPVAYTAAMLDHVAARVAHAQERLGRRLVLENASRYLAFAAAEMDEAEFLAALCARTGCGVLLDVNNLVVNAANLGGDPQRYLAALRPDDVVYFHVAGHCVLPDVRIDTHDAPVPDPVWALYEQACARFPSAGTILERDDRLPDLAALLDELDEARRRHARAQSGAPGGAAVTLAARPVASGAMPRDSGALPEAYAAGQARLFALIAGEAAGAGEDLFDAAAPVPVGRGLRVYRDAYLARLQRGLRENFPALATVMGATAFDAMVAAYVDAHPPRGWRFGALGAALPAFLAGYPRADDCGVPRQVLEDLAALEHAELEVHDAPDDGEALAVSALAEVPVAAWPQLRVRGGAAVRLLHCRADVLGVVEAVAAGRAPERPPARALAVLVARDADGIVRRRLDPEQAAIVERLLAGAPLFEACGGAVEPGAAAIVLLASSGALFPLPPGEKG